MARAAQASLVALATASLASPARAEVQASSRYEGEDRQAPSKDPGSPGTWRRPSADAPLDPRDRVGTLLTGAGLRDVVFVRPERIGAEGAALAWTSGGIVGVALLETRSERAIAELRESHLRTFAPRCVSPPVSKGPPAQAIAGYTLVHNTIRCESDSGVRVTVTTSILDDNDVLTLAHVGPAPETQRLEATNRALGEVLEALVKQWRRRSAR